MSRAPGGRPDPLDGRSLTFSLAAHALALVVVFGVLPLIRQPPILYEAVQVRVVSAARAETPPPDEILPPAAEEELVVETPMEPEPEPEPEPQPVEEAPAPVDEPEPEPEPEEPEPEPVDPEPPPDPDPVPETTTEEPVPETATEDPVPAESDAEEEDEGGEDVNVRMDGLRRDYPAYYQNIIRQVERCFRSPAGDDLEAVVRFVISADGSVGGIGLVRPSGSFVFDRAAEGAVECAGMPGRLGPLPDGYPWERLPIEFRFRPSSRGPDAAPAETPANVDRPTPVAPGEEG